MNLTDTVALALNSDSEAIELLYTQYKRQVYYLALKLMGNPKDASNVLQYTFFQAFHKLGALKNPEKFEPWLYIIASGRSRMLLREKYPLRFAPENDKQKPSSAKFEIRNTPVSSPEIADDTAGRNAVSQIIDKMPEMTRLSVMMYFYCGISVSQIAKVLSSDDAHIRQYLAAGETQLKAEIESMSSKIPSLAGYTGVAEVGTILRRCALSTAISPELDEAIISTSLTLVMASSSVPTDVESTSGTDTPDVKESDEGNYRRLRSAAIRNLITIAVVIVLAVSIIAVSVNIIRRAANNPPIDPDITTTDTEEATVDSTTEYTPSVKDPTSDTTSPETEKDTEPEVTTEPELTTDTPVTTEPEVTTEEVTTEAETEPEEIEGSSMTSAEASKSFVCDVNVSKKTVVIKKYSGNALEVDIPAYIDGIPVTEIGANAFANNTKITSVNIPNSVKLIGIGAFQNCPSLTSVSIPSSVTEIGYYAFLKCTNLSSITVPSSVKSIGYSAFQSTKWLSAQKNEFVIVGDGVLIKYNGKGGNVVIPNTVKKITNAFYFNSNAATVTIPSSVTYIDTFAFYYCSKLTSISFPASVKEMGNNAVSECSKLTSLTAPKGSEAEKWIMSSAYYKLFIAQ